MSKSYDVVVLGGGIGGYTAAMRASRLGKTVAIVERDKLGGTCLHRGCIPSKALLRSAELYADMKRSELFGIETGDVRLNFGNVQRRKAAVIEQLYNGLQFAIRQHRIDVINGNGRIIGPSIFSPRSGAVAVETADGETETLVPGHLIIATGSRPRQLQGLEFDGERILSSDDALALDKLPRSILIVGGGAIGVEWTSLLNDFGVEVTVVEAAERLVPAEDADVARELERLFKKRGIRVVTGARLNTDTVRIDGDGIAVQAETRRGTEELVAEKALVCVGRQANIEHIGLENTDIRLENGVIRVNEFFQTSEPHIYAVGDVNGGLQLAHVAAHEGTVAAEHLAGRKPEPYVAHRFPRCVYSRPELASVGLTEKQAVEQGFEVKTGKISFKAIGKAAVLGDTDGFVKIVADAKTNDVLGVHMIGPHATDMISEAALAQLLEASAWEIGQTVHPHPTLSEALFEAAFAVSETESALKR